jgi:hypothetical protein
MRLDAKAAREDECRALATAIFKHFDVDASGQIEREEMLQLVQAIAKTGAPPLHAPIRHTNLSLGSAASAGGRPPPPPPPFPPFPPHPSVDRQTAAGSPGDEVLLALACRPAKICAAA